MSTRTIRRVEGRLDALVPVPGSKSIANRALVCAALADGVSELDHVPDGDDTVAMTVAPTIPVEAETASAVRTCCHTIQGWRPTSVVIQPDSIATIAATPAPVAPIQNRRDVGGAFFRRNAHPYHADSARSAVPMATMNWNDQ